MQNVDEIEPKGRFHQCSGSFTMNLMESGVECTAYKLVTSSSSFHKQMMKQNIIFYAQIGPQWQPWARENQVITECKRSVQVSPKVKLAIPISLDSRTSLAHNCKVDLGSQIRIRLVQISHSRNTKVQHDQNKQQQRALTTVPCTSRLIKLTTKLSSKIESRRVKRKKNRYKKAILSFQIKNLQSQTQLRQLFIWKKIAHKCTLASSF